ncbi:hypothetical protein GPECTOR_38g270 [Gonium pectorale]|uniref:Uncharacterized protein n=1 Tax=Gonium pectorale TaxID=33097 RepID=A0A150GB82_GONPE|nr:hypothetical protein GPECTOR_38g270 [Gonium pectorale]|eukprot:KXZ47033.1 hypothetical protein GPECTOR_38g270 [Gonium pectorale]
MCVRAGDGSPYVAACRNGDLAMLRCLQRLGVAWGPVGAVFQPFLPPPLLSWLLEAGCPFDYPSTRRILEGEAARKRPGAEANIVLLEQHRRQVEEQPGAG